MAARCLVLLLLCIGDVLSALPAGWSTCQQSSPDYEECLKKEITKAIVSLKNGNKKLGVLPLEPLRFEEMNVNQGTGPVRINLQLKDVDFRGMSAAIIRRVKNDGKKMIIELDFPRFVIDGTYSIKGQVLVLPISGNGKCNMVWDNVRAKFDIDFKEVKKGNQSYYQVTAMPVDVDPKKVTMNFENLFNGNKALGDNMNKFLNENWQEIVEDLKPAISRALELGYKEYINRVLIKIPANEFSIK